MSHLSESTIEAVQKKVEEAMNSKIDMVKFREWTNMKGDEKYKFTLEDIKQELLKMKLPEKVKREWYNNRFGNYLSFKHK